MALQSPRARWRRSLQFRGSSYACAGNRNVALAYPRMSVLHVSGLTKRFGKKIAVDDISFEVRGGEIVGLLGPNGAGKSTTFLCTAGLLRPDSGRFFWEGHELGNARSQT